MSFRNKKLTALNNINHSLGNSLEKSNVYRGRSNDNKFEKTLLEKLNDKPTPKRFYVKKIITGDHESI